MDTLCEDAETGCCPRFDPEPWDGKEHVWQDKLFLKDHVTSFLHIPLNFGKVIVRDMEKIQKADALTPEPLMLSDERSSWGSDVYIAVTKDVPGAEMARISGTFLTKVFEGPFKDTGKWMKEMETFISRHLSSTKEGGIPPEAGKSRGKEAKKIYCYYTTCPGCAKHYGKNYVVLVAQV